VKVRAAVILIQNDNIALIERNRSGRHYYVFPGGKIEVGESPAIAAKREAKEEIGQDVKIGPLVAEVWCQGSPQYYYLADALNGQFGHGSGAEMSSLPDSKKGTYLPVWMLLDELPSQPVLPKLMAEFIWKSHHSGWPEHPLIVTDRPPDAPG
jgi:8-oxo-dGTP diphosphatase